MISDIALSNFDGIWKLFGNKENGLLNAGGSMFLIEPFNQFFSLEFANSLTIESAHDIFHLDMAKWGRIEQNEHEREIIDYYELPNGKKYPITQFKDLDVRWARNFIISAFYNLCCLASRKKTIEEFIFVANQSPADNNPEEINKAFFELIGISNSFLTTEWTKEIILRAISNRDSGFFKDLSKCLNKDIAPETFDTARTWLGTTMLWYLGGKDMKRRDFMLLLRTKDVLSPQVEELSFNSQLSKLRLIK